MRPTYSILVAVSCCSLIIAGTIHISQSIARDWSGSRTAQPVEIIKTVEVPVEKIVEIPKIPDTSPKYLWSEELKSLTSEEIIPRASQTKPIQLYWEMQSHRNCPNCPGEWRRISTDQELLSRGWKFSGDYVHFKVREHIEFDQTFPSWNLITETGQIIATLPSGTSPALLSATFSEEYNTRRSVVMKDIPAKSFNAGRITNVKWSVDTALRILGDSGTLKCPRTIETFEMNGVIVKLPKDAEFSWNTLPNGQVSATITPSCSASWDFIQLISLSLHGLTYNKDTGVISFQSPLSLLSPYIILE